MLDLGQIRNEIDGIDKQLVELFEQRMKLTKEVAEYKIQTGKKVLDRERKKATGIYCAISQRNISRKQRNAISGQHRTACLWIKDHTSVHTVKTHRIFLWQPDLENGG